jgi:hypothetical protein
VPSNINVDRRGVRTPIYDISTWSIWNLWGQSSGPFHSWRKRRRLSPTTTFADVIGRKDPGPNSADVTRARKTPPCPARIRDSYRRSSPAHRAPPPRPGPVVSPLANPGGRRPRRARGRADRRSRIQPCFTPSSSASKSLLPGRILERPHPFRAANTGRNSGLDGLGVFHVFRNGCGTPSYQAVASTARWDLSRSPTHAQQTQ